MWKQCLFNRKAHRFYHTADFPDGLLSKLKSLNLTIAIFAYLDVF